MKSEWFSEPTQIFTADMKAQAANLWTMEGRDCRIILTPRPTYCDRGDWLAHIEIKPSGDNHKRLGLDWADGWPRYFFDLERAKLEIESWLKKRKQWLPQ